MPEYAWMCLNKQDSEHASGPKYAKILNMAKFWIRQSSQYASVSQLSEYTLTASKYVGILNMAGFSRCKSYTGF